MSKTKPKLFVFTISHFCEKARWALDAMQIEYELRVIAPGAHIKAAKKLGLERGSTPFLDTSEGVVQGSGAIIDWAEAHANSSALTNAVNTTEISDIESRLDQTLGVHMRRWYYSEAIIEHPKLVKPIFLQDISMWEKFMFSLAWPTIQKLMIKHMDLGAEQGAESFNIVKQELAWLETLLEDKPYLLGENFSRADITAAALIAPMIKPDSHPCSQYIQHPPLITQQCLELENNRVCQWVKKMYAQHR